ncbi:hypothetical protein FQZ97_1170540 [compost metagenome]
MQEAQLQRDKQVFPALIDSLEINARLKRAVIPLPDISPRVEACAALGVGALREGRNRCERGGAFTCL